MVTLSVKLDKIRKTPPTDGVVVVGETECAGSLSPHKNLTDGRRRGRRREPPPDGKELRLWRRLIIYMVTLSEKLDKIRKTPPTDGVVVGETECGGGRRYTHTHFVQQSIKYANFLLKKCPEVVVVIVYMVVSVKLNKIRKTPPTDGVVVVIYMVVSEKLDKIRKTPTLPYDANVRYPVSLV